MPNDDSLTGGEQAAEKVAAIVGSWRFVIWQNVAVLLWTLFNVVAIFGLHWDPYPFILLNLVFSWQASNTGPILQMTGNAGAKRDRSLWHLILEILQLIKRVLERVEKTSDHVEKMAQADHVEHGKLLREIHSHIYCQGHTTLGEQVELAKPSHALRGPDGRFIKAS